MLRTIRAIFPHSLAVLALLALGGAPALLAAGCNYVTPALWIAQGPPKQPAECTLPKDKKTVVFVDDQKSVVSRLQLRSMLADDVGQTIKAQGVVNDVVSGRELIAYVRRNETSNKRLPIDDLGRAVGADIVIYIEMVEFALTPDGATPKPTAMVRIKVVDVKARERIFPPSGGESDGFEVRAETEALSADAYRTSAARRRTEEMLEKKLADAIAKVFYEHEPSGFGQGVSHMEN